MNDNLYDPGEFPIPITLKSKIMPKTCAPEFGGELFALTNSSSHLGFGCPALAPLP